MSDENNRQSLDDFLHKIEGVVIKKYEAYILAERKKLCEKAGNQEVGSIGKPIFTINFFSLSEAIEEIKKDIRFMFERRGARIGANRPSPGKIAGVMVYRLSRSHVVHLMEGCASCEIQCTAKSNFKFAVKCAWEYVGIPYLRVREEIRRELLYSLALRHVNQETLALVFDIILYHRKPTNSP
jgi:hypothetical protein